MTEDERRNRNPAPASEVVKLADCPEIRVADLELHRVYILQGERYAATMNYLGTGYVNDPVTLDAVLAHVFFGPRGGLSVSLRAAADGTLHSGDGKKVTLRKYVGEDS